MREKGSRGGPRRGLEAKILPKFLPAALPPKPGSVDTLHLPFLFLLLPQEAGKEMNELKDKEPQGHHRPSRLSPPTGLLKVLFQRPQGEDTGDLLLPPPSQK